MASFSYFHISILVFQFLALLATAQFDFFYFVQQWPGSYCDTKRSCCYPTGNPPSDFGIHGLWPNYANGKYPSNCDSDTPFDESQITDLVERMGEEWPSLTCPSSNGVTFWSHEWNKHGTCAESELDQHSYFSAALELKTRSNLLQNLRKSGINPDGGEYPLKRVIAAIRDGIGHTPFIQCNVDSEGNRQLYQVYICVDKNGSDFIDCPIFPSDGACSSNIGFPPL